MREDSPLGGLESDEPEPFRVNAGFIAFLSMLALPVVLAVVVYAGAALVASDVYAADDAAAAQKVLPQGSGPSFQSEGKDVAGWKRTLIGVCPLH